MNWSSSYQFGGKSPLLFGSNTAHRDPRLGQVAFEVSSEPASLWLPFIQAEIPGDATSPVEKNTDSISLFDFYF